MIEKTDMSFKLPDVKKKISAFLSEEDGSITKQAVVAAGVTVALASLASATRRGNCNGVNAPKDPPISHNGGTVTHYNKVDGPLEVNPYDTEGGLWDGANSVVSTHTHCVKYHYNHASY